VRAELGACAAAALAGLGALHGYWAARGGPVSAAVVPEIDGAPAFQPTRGQTVAVAAALGAGAALMLAAIGLPLGLPVGLARVGCGVMGLVFAARTVGDFRLVGLFKRDRGSRFAFWDDRAFTPICALLSLASLVVALG
jgi:hypothetical protein